jgi:hypothetical protein
MNVNSANEIKREQKKQIARELRQKANHFINRRGITGLVGFSEQSSPIREPIGRFRVGLMTYVNPSS